MFDMFVVDQSIVKPVNRFHKVSVDMFDVFSRSMKSIAKPVNRFYEVSVDMFDMFVAVRSIAYPVFDSPCSVLRLIVKY